MKVPKQPYRYLIETEIHTREVGRLAEYMTPAAFLGSLLYSQVITHGSAGIGLL